MASHDESVQEIQEKDESLIKSVSAFFSEVSAYLGTQQREITNNIQLIVEAQQERVDHLLEDTGASAVYADIETQQRHLGQRIDSVVEELKEGFDSLVNNVRTFRA